MVRGLEPNLKEVERIQRSAAAGLERYQGSFDHRPQFSRVLFFQIHQLAPLRHRVWLTRNGVKDATSIRTIQVVSQRIERPARAGTHFRLAGAEQCSAERARYRSDAVRMSPPSAGNPPCFGAPPAPDTSTPPAPRSFPLAPPAEWLRAEPPPAPNAAIPSSRYDRTGAPTRRARSRSAAPTPPAACPPPAQSRVRSAGARGPAARPQPRSSATPLLPRCPGPVAPAPRFVCSRR